MKRKITELFGRVPARVRKPAAMLVMGLALMAPGGFMALGEDHAAAKAELDAARASGLTDAAQSTVASAWRTKALERRRAALTERFAAHFEIPVDLAQDIHLAAVEAEVDPEVAFGLVRTESAFDSVAVSYAGAVGYTQLLPSTARWIEPGTSRSELFDGSTNLSVGFKYLRYLLDKYDGNTRLALTAYNRGPGTVDRLLRRGRAPWNGYADKVLNPQPGRRI